MIKITKNNSSFPVIHELVRERRFRPVFEADNQAKISKTVHSRRRLPPATDTTPGERRDFVVVHRGSIMVVQS